MDTTLDNWVEWKVKCDLRLCGAETQAALRAYANKRLHRLVSNALYNMGKRHIDGRELDGQQCWDLFEGFYADVSSRTGKVYKDWLFTVVAAAKGDPVDVTERQVNELLYNVVRKFIQDNYPRRGVASLDAPIQVGDPDSGTLLDLVSATGVGTREQVEAEDARGVAAGMSERFFAEMSRRERVVLAALGLGLPASCPEAERAAGCKKSMLAAARGQIDARLKQRLKREMPEDAEFLRFYAVEALVEKCIDWAKGETSCEPIFRLLDARRAQGGRP